MLKLHKIPDRFIFRLVFLLIILWNLKYLFLIVQVPFTMFFVDYINKNAFYSQVNDIRNSIKTISNFQDEGKIGFVSDVPKSSVFDIEDSIRSFYITQYAIVPSILKNNSQGAYVMGVYENAQQDMTAPDNYEIFKKINDKTYILKRIED